MSARLIDERDAAVVSEFIGLHWPLFKAHVAKFEQLDVEQAEVRCDAITDKLATDQGLS
jgi:hypothetical protein